MIVRVVILLGILLPRAGWSTGGITKADGGKGKLMPKVEKTVPVTPIRTGSDTCYFDVADQKNGRYAFETPSRFLASLPVSKGKGDKLRYKIVQGNLDTFQMQPLMEMELENDHVLVPIGRPIRSVKVISYSPLSGGCYDGPAKWIGVPIQPLKGQVTPATGKGLFQPVDSPSGPVLYVSNRRRFIDIDPELFQTRQVLWPLEELDFPIFVSPQEQLILLLKRRDKRQVGLYRNGKEEKVWPLDRTERVVPIGSNSLMFGIAKTDVGRNRFAMTVKAAVGQSADRLFEIQLPSHYKVGDAQLSFGTTSQTILVAGRHQKIRKQWRKAFVFDGNTGSMLSDLNVPEGEYLNSAVFDPAGKMLLLEYAADSVLKSVRIWEIRNQRWRTLTF